MSDRLGLDREKIRRHPNGITLAGFEPEKKAPASPVLGYLARLCPLKGLDILVDAFLQLKSTDKYPDLRLEIAGGMTVEDEPLSMNKGESSPSRPYGMFFHPPERRP